MAGSALTSEDLRKAPYRTARCLLLEAGPWENPKSGILGRAAGNVAQGGTVTPSCNRKGRAGIPPPKGARASALPDREHPDRVFTSLHHLIDGEWMREAYRRTRKDGATGIDGVTAADYEKDLEANLESLLDRIK